MLVFAKTKITTHRFKLGFQHGLPKRFSVAELAAVFAQSCGDRQARVIALTRIDARFPIVFSNEALDKPLVGETVLLSQKVIDLAKDAANGVRGHVGLTIDAPIPAIQEFGKKFEAKFGYKSDHNGVKGYIAPYMLKTAAERAGKLDAKAIATALRGLTITPDKLPGILIEATWRHRRHRPHLIPSGGQGRQTDHHSDAAETWELSTSAASAALLWRNAPRPKRF